MRNFFVFGLALVIFGAVILSYVPIGLTSYRDVGIWRAANMTSVESTDSNAVEVDGIRFEILVPERVWIIPENKPDAATPVRIGIRIKNQTLTPLRFSRFFSLIPQLVAPDGQSIERGGGSDSTFPPKESDYPITLPRQSITFFLNGRLLWRNNKLQLAFDDGFGGVISFLDLKPGKYQLRLVYTISNATAQAYDQDIVFGRTLKGFWTGRIVTAFVEVRLVYP